MRVLIIALDGATFDILDPWLAAGELPTLARLRDTGTKAQLMTTFPPITAAAWNSFATGKNPGKHGIFEFLQRRTHSYGVEPMNASQRQARSLWRILSDAGKRSVVINVPMTYPPEPIRGALVAGMPVPSGRTDFAYPAELSAEILDWMPDYTINASTVYVRGKAEAFLADVRRELDQRLTLAERLMQREAWDLAMVHILGTDRIQHEFWHCMDTTHPQHKGEATRYQNAILDYYRDIDAQLERILKFADQRTTVIVLSDHGFGALHKFVYLNSWLLEQGFLVLRRGGLTLLKRAAFRLGFSPTNIYKMVAALGLGGMRGDMDMGTRQQLLDTLFLSFNDVDWSRTRAYARGNFGQIFINLAGREPQGVVQPGTDYENTVRAIIERLPTLQDPQTGAILASHAKQRDELFSGGATHHAPDIAIFMRDETYVGLGTADFPASGVAGAAFGNTGDHRYNGILIMQGNGVKPGDLGNASLMDIAPTVLHLLGVPVPDDMDGQVLLNALDAARQDVQYTPAAPTEIAIPDAAYTPDEEAEMLQHLQDLGYLG